MNNYKDIFVRAVFRMAYFTALNHLGVTAP
jgi:hypothetical protein